MDKNKKIDNALKELLEKIIEDNKEKIDKFNNKDEFIIWIDNDGYLIKKDDYIKIDSQCPYSDAGGFKVSQFHSERMVISRRKLSEETEGMTFEKEDYVFHEAMLFLLKSMGYEPQIFFDSKYAALIYRFLL